VVILGARNPDFVIPKTVSGHPDNVIHGSEFVILKAVVTGGRAFISMPIDFPRTDPKFEPYSWL
jgi:hypothetical protein